jgi:hypothetical protein
MITKPQLIHRLSSVEHAEKHCKRPAGFTRQCLKHGNYDGEHIIFTRESWMKVHAWVESHRPPVQGAALRERPGLGDLVGSIATPIARALHMPCIDPATGQLRPESGCQKRKTFLNKIHL